MNLDNVYNLNALTGLDELPDESIHLIVTSPPYNNGQPYLDYDDAMTPVAYFRWMKRVLARCLELLVPGGRLCINVPNTSSMRIGKNQVTNYYMYPEFRKLLLEVGFQERACIVWIKSYTKAVGSQSCAWGSWGLPSAPFVRGVHEYILVWHKDQARLDPPDPNTPMKDQTDLTDSEFAAWTIDTWFFPSCSHPAHPATFPEELPMRCIKLFSWIGNTVLDPFAGVGTTLKVARELRRRYIGFELSEKYWRLARSTIKVGQRNLEAFI